MTWEACRKAFSNVQRGRALGQRKEQIVAGEVPKGIIGEL